MRQKKRITFSMESVPHVPPNVVRRDTSMPSVYLFFDPDTPNWISVNEHGKEILKLCNGKRTVSRICKIIGRRYNIDNGELGTNVLDFLNEINSKEFLSDKPFSLLRATKHHRRLTELWLHVTNECNLRCLHCHLASGNRLEPELGKEEIFRTIDQLAQLGGGRMMLSGGEPLCRPDINEILTYASAKIKTVVFVTNGTMVNKEKALYFKKFKNVYVQVSLDGPTARIHDKIRGKGNFRKAVKGIQALREADVSTSIGMTLMKPNAKEIYKMAHLCKALRISTLHLGLLQLKGRAKKNEKSLFLSNMELIKSWRDIEKVYEKTGIVVDMTEGINQNVGMARRNDFCGGGAGLLSVSSDGFVYPCPGLHHPVFRAGNIRTQTLEDIWRNSEVLRKLRGLRVTHIPKCKKCILRYICGGGCHVWRYYQKGKLLTPQPYCNLFKNIYLEKLSQLAAKERSSTESSETRAQPMAKQ